MTTGRDIDRVYLAGMPGIENAGRATASKLAGHAGRMEGSNAIPKAENPLAAHPLDDRAASSTSGAMSRSKPGPLLCFALTATLLSPPTTNASLVGGSDFQVNTYTTSFQDSARAITADDGSFIVVWKSVGSFDGDSRGILLQRFDQRPGKRR